MCFYECCLNVSCFSSQHYVSMIFVKWYRKKNTHQGLAKSWFDFPIKCYNYYTGFYMVLCVSLYFNKSDVYFEKRSASLHNEKGLKHEKYAQFIATYTRNVNITWFVHKKHRENMTSSQPEFRYNQHFSIVLCPDFFLW